MDEEKKIPENESLTDAANEAGESAPAQDAADTKAKETKYEENDNWEFEAQAPTLDAGLIEDDQFAIEVPAPAEKKQEQVKESPVAASGSGQITISTAPIKIACFAVLFAAVVAVLVFLGVRYYTVPNGKEGELMNPGSVAMTIGDTDISIGTYNYYYSKVVSNYQTYAGYGYFDLDTTKDYSKQYTTDDDGNQITWLELFEQKTIDQLQYVTAYYEAGVKDGVTLTKEQEESIQEQLSSLETTASEAKQSLDDYLSDNIAEYCSKATLETVQRQAYIAENYYQKVMADSQVSDEDFQSYFKKNSSNYYNCSFAFIEMTYDTTSEETKAQSIEKAKKYLTKIHSVEDMKKLIPTVCADLIQQYISSGYFEDEDEAVEALAEYVDNTMTAKDDSFGQETTDWLFNSETKVGDTTYYCDEDAGFIYLILKTGEPALDESVTYSVRHLLVMPESAEEEADSESSDASDTEKEYTEEEWQAAKEKADSLLATYNKGEKTEYAFAMLAEENSDDTQSISSSGSGMFGGIIEGTKEGAMVEEFENWALDDARKYGDTAIVKSQYGYHIMFFIDACTQYEYDCKKDIRSEQEEKFVDSCTVRLNNTTMKKTTVAEPVSSSSGE